MIVATHALLAAVAYLGTLTLRLPRLHRHSRARCTPSTMASTDLLTTPTSA
jgi:hypothetical protein